MGEEGDRESVQEEQVTFRKRRPCLGGLVPQRRQPALLGAPQHCTGAVSIHMPVCHREPEVRDAAQMGSAETREKVGIRRKVKCQVGKSPLNLPKRQATQSWPEKPTQLLQCEEGWVWTPEAHLSASSRSRAHLGTTVAITCSVAFLLCQVQGGGDSTPGRS